MRSKVLSLSSLAFLSQTARHGRWRCAAPICHDGGRFATGLLLNSLQMNELEQPLVRGLKGEFDPLGSKFGRCEERFIARVGISFSGPGLLVSKDLADEEQ